MSPKHNAGMQCVRLVLLAALCCGLCACDMISYRKYTNRQQQFSILLPRSWQEAKDPKAVILVKAPLDSRDDKFQENINVMVTQLPAKVTLETFVDYNKEELMRVMPKATDMREQSVYNALLPGRLISFNNDVDGVELRVLSGVWIKENRIYVVTCVGQAKKIKQYLPVFNYVMRSLRMW